MNKSELKCFLVWHDGYWHGGSTIVFATDEQTASDMVTPFLQEYYKEPIEVNNIDELPMVGCYMIDDGDE